MKRVDDDTVARAYNHFVDVFYPDLDRINSLGKGLCFWRFLGMEVAPNAGGPSWNLTDDAAHRCYLLASPHYQAIAKLMSLKGHTHDVKCKTYLSIEMTKDHT
jgi:hypothetical protein